MNKKSLFYSGVLLIVLVVTSVLIGRGVIQGVVNASDINLALPNNPATGNNEFFLGQTIHWTGTVAFANQEFATLHAVTLIVSGPQGMTASLPTAPGTYTLSGSSIKGTLIVTVTHSGIVSVTFGTTLPGGGTLPEPNTLFGSSGGRFKGVGTGAVITYTIDWTPPVFLDPPPTFTLLPNTEMLFSIPTLPPAATTTDTVLPATDQKFTIPSVGAPTGTTLPSLDLFFTIPTLSESTNAATTTPNLPDVRFTSTTAFGNVAGFNIPQLPVTAAPSGVNDFPELTQFFTIPMPTTASAPSGVPNMPEFALDYTITTTPAIHGLATNNSDYWVIADNTGPGGFDEILRLNSSGQIIDTIPSPSAELGDVLFLNNFLWVAENVFRCFDTIDDSRCDRSHRIFKFNPAAAPTSTSGWDDLTTINTSELGMSIGALAAEDSGSTGTLWVTPRFGGRLFNIQQNGSELSSPFTDFFVPNMDALAFDNDLLYSSSGNTITQWTKDGKRVTDFSAVRTITATSINNIKGMTFRTVASIQVLFIGSTGGNVYKGFFAPTVTNTPRGLAYSPSSSSIGEALWVVVDAEPKDKILRLDVSSGTLATSFDTDGVADAPSGQIQGIAFLSNFLYLISNEGGFHKLYKFNPTTATVTNTFDLGTTATIYDDLTAIATDGTNLIVHVMNYNRFFVLSTAGIRTGIETRDPCCPTYFGLNALGYHSGRTQFLGAKDDKVGSYDNNLNLVSETTFNATSSITGVKGIAFNSDLMYVAHATGKISRSFLGTTITTRPRGAAFSDASSGAGRALWVLVDGTPKDKLLKVNPDTGALITTFSDDGAVDAPSVNTEGITYLDTGTPSTSFLWIVANDGFDKKLYKVNATTGAIVSTFVLSGFPGGFFFDDLGDITNDGTNLIIHAKSNNRIAVVDTTGAKVSETFPFGSGGFDFGATALARHSGRSQVFSAKSDKLRTISSDMTIIEQDQTLSVDGGSISNIDGMSFDRDVAYVAYYTGTLGRVAIGALRATVSNTPRGIAFSSDGSILQGVLIDEAIWVLVDGDPKDKILKLNASTGALLTSFSDDGAVDAPSKNTEGITFLNGFLWVVANDNFDKKLYKIRATDGAVSQTLTLNGYPTGFIFDDMGDISNDGTNLLISLKTQDRIFVVDTSGARISDRYVCCPMGFGATGATGVAFRSAGSQVFSGRNSEIFQTIVEGPDYRIIREFTGLAINGIQGMVFIDDRLYVAHTGSGLVSRAFVPSDTTNNPQGLSYNAGADEFYVLVDGAGKASDRVVVVSGTSTGTTTPGVLVKRSFQTPDDDANDLTFLNGTLYVSVFDDEPPCCAPPTNHIFKLNPTTGAQTGDLVIGFIPDKISALTNDGTNLIAWPETPGLQAILINPSTGSEIEKQFFFDETDPFGFFEDRFQAVAFQSSSKQLFPAKQKKFFQFDENGRKLARFDITTGVLFDDIRGAVFKGDVLFMAEAGGDTVHSARIPTPPTVVTTNPLGMASDGTNLFVLVDATPKDKILKVNSSTGALMTSFDAPGGDADALAFHQGFLYVVTNDEQFFKIPGPFGPTFERRSLPVLNKLDPMTGAKLSEMTIPVSGPPGTFPFLGATVSALASDGTSLYLGLKDGPTDPSSPASDWFRFNPSTPFSPAVGIDEQPGALPEIFGIEAFVITMGPLFPANRQLIGVGQSIGAGAGANNDRLVRMNKDTGAVFQQFTLMATTTPIDIRGLAYIGRTLFLADDGSNVIRGTSLQENTIELTVLGEYGSVLNVDMSTNVTTTLSHRTANRPFEIIRSAQVQLKLTSPLPNFVQTSTTSTISGLVSDPSIRTTTVGVLLPFTNIIQDPVTNPGSMSLWDAPSFEGGAANWHIACTSDAAFLSDKAVSPSCAWRYSRPGQSNFDTGSRTAGALEATTIFTVRNNTILSFNTWYDTEAEAFADQKFVEVAVVTQDAAGNDIVGPYQKIAQIVGFLPLGTLAPAGAHPSFVFLNFESFEFGPGGQAQFRPANLPLLAFNNQRLKVRFNFDSIDRFANGGLGWFLDDIVVAGSDMRTVEVSTTPITPITMGGVTFFRSFTTLFQLSEGANLVIATGVQPYSPFLMEDDQVEGFLDSRPPVIFLFGIPTPTNQENQNLQGNVQDLTFEFAELFQTDGAGTRSIGSVTAFGNFNQPVLLSEGKTVFTAIAHDRGGLISTESLVILADFTPPTVMDNGPIYPLGAVSARTLDDIIFQVTASDGVGDVSGVGSVKLLGSGNVVIANLLRAMDIPQIVVDMFGISGNWVQFVKVPNGTQGRVSIKVRATDVAGNSSVTDLFADVTPSLLAQNIRLFDGANLVGVNLQNKGADPDFDVLNVLGQRLDTTVLDAGFRAGIDNVLAMTFATISPDSTPPVSINVTSTANIQAGDRLRVGSGDTKLTQQANAGANTLRVASTQGFSVGQVIAIGAGEGPFRLGVKLGGPAFQTTTVAAINAAAKLVTTTNALLATRLTGVRVTGIQHVRVVSVNGVTKDVQIALGFMHYTAGTIVMEEPKLGDVISGIFHFTGGLSVGGGANQGVFLQFITGLGGDLLKLQQGRSYWFITKTDAFRRSAPLFEGSEGPIIPVRMQLDGVFFDATGNPPSLPATFTLAKDGWHMISLIAERRIVASEGVRGAIANSTITSLVEFQKFIEFDPDTGTVNAVSGALSSLGVVLGVRNDTMEVGRGFLIRIVNVNPANPPQHGP